MANLIISVYRGDSMFGKRKYRYMSLAAAIESQHKNYPTTICHNCVGEKKLVGKPYSFAGLVVWDLPQYECSNCGATSHRFSVGIAIEQLREKFNLRGGYQVKELLEIEKKNE
ncbi:hypothetical protein [Marinicrinis lubricantis]|uniref:YgiT-type zinc finger domain-containing protein n=1 Tax=Marinicrinis lubricantis TaxID=2086470 RepID=A0ABW1IPI5_9BACL